MTKTASFVPTLHRRHLALASVLAVFALGVGDSQLLQAQADCEDLSGVYDVIVDLPGSGPTPIELDLEQEGCALSGFVGAQTRTAIEDGLVEGATATFTFAATNQGNGSSLQIRWAITVEGEDVTGTFSHDLFGNIEVVGSRRS